jgi:hypothetical protein
MCFNGDWDCGTCPASQPQGGSSCGMLSLIQCQYGNAYCTCNQGNWQCSGSSQCPVQPPQPGSSCNLAAGTQCSWGGLQCICSGNQWYCN